MFTPLQAGIGIELAVLALVLIVLFGTYTIIKTVKPLIVNAVVGLLVLLLAGALGYGVEITVVVVLLVAFGGVPAALLVILLARFTNIAFEPAMIVFQHLPF